MKSDAAGGPRGRPKSLEVTASLSLLQKAAGGAPRSWSLLGQPESLGPRSHRPCCKGWIELLPLPSRLEHQDSTPESIGFSVCFSLRESGVKERRGLLLPGAP